MKKIIYTTSPKNTENENVYTKEMNFMWETLRKEEVEEKLNTDFCKGLSDDEVLKRQNQYGKNELENGKKEGIIRYAMLIRQIHQVDMTGFPFVHDLSYKLAKVKETVARHEAKEQYFEREYQGWSPEKMLARLESLSGFQEDLVFCHGDVCMPNFLYEGHQLTAVLDVSGAGINDRYLDLSIALRTLRYNLEGLGWTLTQADVDLFLRTYDYPFDKQRFEFYLILDELMNG